MRSFKLEKIVLITHGLKCGGCETALKAALEAVPGIANARADHLTGHVNVEFDPAKIDIDRIKQIIEDQNLNFV